ncbi:hypothetical protein BLNAU_10111 [Blattamonas nauphoetae]|uniref:Uncharacterized protein n=1 Tax=Blattamonas nauphoetae TaxID=2049346 RepID=A0ABQ9XU14_9EUKA|nr:hypothetical protein BLNAU_10111 [Blattamonas nauphoetae]
MSKSKKKSGQKGKRKSADFLTIDPNTVRTIDELSRVFLTIVAFVRSGKEMDSSAEKKANHFLCLIGTPATFDFCPPSQLLTELVPTELKTTDGLADSVIVLLSSPTPSICSSALSLLHRLVDTHSKPSFLLDFVESGFFGDLPESFRESPTHVSPESGLSFVWIVFTVASLGRPSTIRSLCNQTRRSEESIRNALLNHILVPLDPLWRMMWTHRLSFDDRFFFHPAIFRNLIALLVHVGLSHPPTLDFVLSSPICLVLVSLMASVTTIITFSNVLDSLEDERDEWEREETEMVMKGRKRVNRKLRTEGMENELEHRMLNPNTNYRMKSTLRRLHVLMNADGANLADSRLPR